MPSSSLRHDIAQARLVAREQGQTGSFRRQPFRDCQADAGPGAGDESVFARPGDSRARVYGCGARDRRARREPRGRPEDDRRRLHGDDRRQHRAGAPSRQRRADRQDTERRHHAAHPQDHGSVTAPNEMTTCRVPRRAPPPRNSSSNSSNRAPSSSSSAAVSWSVADDVCAARRHLGGSSCSRRSASRRRCCWRPTSSSRRTVASRPSASNSIRAAAARQGRSRPAPPLGLLDESPLGERAQVVAARRGAVADRGTAFGRGRVIHRVQVVEQREPRRMREGAHRARVGQCERAIERDLSKLLFREPCVKHEPFLLAREAGRRVCRRLARAHPGERVAHGLGERARLEPGGERGRRRRSRAFRGAPGRGARAAAPSTRRHRSRRGSRRRPRRARRPSRRPRRTSRTAPSWSWRGRPRCTCRLMPFSAARTIQLARSRPSITCAGASGGAGASTRPPAAIRSGQ